MTDFFPPVLSDGRRRNRRAEVAAWIRRQAAAVTVEEVREAFGLSVGNSQQVVCRLLRDGTLKRVRAATYALKEEATR